MEHGDILRKQLAQCIQSHGRLLFRLAWNVLHDSHAAEDVCQHALFKACTHLDGGRDEKTLRNWLARTVVNDAIGELRRKTRRDRLLRTQFAGAPDAATDQPDIAMREAVYLGLEQLEPEARAVVVMRIMEGRGGQEVAEILNISVATVSRRLHEAMTQLRRHLNSESSVLSARGVP